MSEPSADAGDVEPSPAEEQNLEHQLQPHGQAVEQREDAAGGSPPPGASDAPAPDGDLIKDTIEQLEAQARTALEQKVRADTDFADLQNRLTTLRNVQKDADAATTAYAAAYDQLRREDRAYEEYLTFEEGSLRQSLGDDGVTAVEELVRARSDRTTELEQKVTAAADDLAAATAELDALERQVKERGDALGGWKKLTATVTAQHTQLRTMREESTKARQAGEYALAYWLLQRARERRESFAQGPRLTRPEQVPDALLEAVQALADAEQKYAAAQRTVAAGKEDLAAATKERDKHTADSEAQLRDALRQTAAADATGESDHA